MRKSKTLVAFFRELFQSVLGKNFLENPQFLSPYSPVLINIINMYRTAGFVLSFSFHFKIKSFALAQ